ncbi:MAG: hypothetical protein RL693_638 [Verrucomicrobiota bacterium]|jgi:hypothetical protein
MQKGKSKYERIILAAMAIVAIAVSAWLIMQANGFSATIQTPTFKTGNEVGTPPLAGVDEAIAIASADPKPWLAPVRNNKPVPLNKSVLLVQKEEEIFDLFLDDKPLRPPMTNKFLRENDLEYLSPNVGDLDADVDGFTNKEEFEKATSPKDPKSHPPITDKLFLVERISHDYKINLKSSSSPHQVATPDDRQKKNWFVDPNSPEPAGKSFGAGGRFVATAFEKKVIPDPTVGEKDVSELTVNDTLRKNTIVLVMGTEQNLADYEAKFEFRLHKVITIKAKKGDSFRIEGYADTTYKVLDIQEDSAAIAPLKEDGTYDKNKEILIKKG